ncbi:unnamed protein product [Arabidopsis halleri]
MFRGLIKYRLHAEFVQVLLLQSVFMTRADSCFGPQYTLPISKG